MLKCPYCNKEFNYKKGLQGHIRFNHRQDKYPKIKKRSIIINAIEKAKELNRKGDIMNGDDKIPKLQNAQMRLQGRIDKLQGNIIEKDEKVSDVSGRDDIEDDGDAEILFYTETVQKEINKLKEELIALKNQFIENETKLKTLRISASNLWEGVKNYGKKTKNKTAPAK